MSKNDDEFNEFIDEVSDGTYNLTCVEVIFKLVKQIQSQGDERIKKIVVTLVVEGIKICITDDIWYSYSYVCAYFLQYTFQDTFTEVRWSVRWRGYDGTGHTMVALDLEEGQRESLLQLENSMMFSRKALQTRHWKTH